MDPRSVDEIAKIEHDLELLRSAYATMAYWARVVRVFVWLMTIPFAGLMVYLLYTDVVGGAAPHRLLACRGNARVDYLPRHTVPLD